MHALIEQHLDSIEAICRRYHVRKLDVFGSAARASDFNPQTSDADFLVEFSIQPKLRLLTGTKSELEELLGRPVDLVERGAVRNPYVLADMNRYSQNIYVA